MKNALIILLLSSLYVSGQDRNSSFEPFEKNGKFGFRKGSIERIPATFEYACNFTEGLALVKTNGLWGFIDTLGKWKIPAVYEKSEPFFEGVAQICSNGKVGLINNEGKMLVKPEVQKIVRDYAGYRLYNGKLRGLYTRNYEQAIPALYADFNTHDNDHVSAKKENGLWDFYQNGKLLLQNMDSPAAYIMYNNASWKIRMQGFTGMYGGQKGWIIPPAYEQISAIGFPEYEAGGKKYEYILVLQDEDATKFDRINDPEKEGAVKFAKANGEFISDEQFMSYDSYVDPYTSDCNVCIVASTINHSFIIGKDMKLSKLRFNSLKPQMYWFIADGPQYDYILDGNLQVMDSFAVVRPYREIDYENYFGEDFDIPYYEIDNEAFVMVSNVVDGIMKTAIYELNEKKVVSGWFPDDKIYVKRWRLSNNMVYIYSEGESGQQGYFITGMEIGTPTVYERCETFDGFLITKKSDEKFTELFMLQNSSLVKMLEESSIASSRTLSYPMSHDDPDQQPDAFQMEFLYVLNDRNQYEIICQNGKKSSAFDTLLPNLSMSQFITTVKNGKYGAVNLYDGSEIKPVFNAPLSINYMPEVFNEYFAQIGEDANAYYVNSKGKKFFTMNPEVIIFKEKGLYGFKSASDFSERTETVIPPTYKEIKKDGFSNLLIVKNAQKKYGIINIYGDTILDLKYDKIENSGSSNYLDGQTFTIKTNKNVGLFSQYRGIIIPTLYDEIKEYYMSPFFNTFLAKKKGKTALYSGKMLVLPEGYEEIDHFIDTENSYQHFFSGKRNGKYYVQPTILQDEGYQKVDSISGPFDLIEANYGYNISGGQYKRYDLATGKYIETVESTNAEFTNGLFKIAFRNGKWGALDLNGKELVPFIYESAAFMDYREEVMIGIENGTTYYIYVATNERYTEDQW